MILEEEWMPKLPYLLLWPLTAIMGCPCCGPRWYKRLHIAACRLAGDPIPPELGGYPSTPGEAPDNSQL